MYGSAVVVTKGAVYMILTVRTIVAQNNTTIITEWDHYFIAVHHS
jgi:hypothetical protein